MTIEFFSLPSSLKMESGSIETSPPKRDAEKKANEENSLKNTLIQALKMERKPQVPVEEVKPESPTTVKSELVSVSLQGIVENTNTLNSTEYHEAQVVEGGERKRKINFAPDDALISDIFHYSTNIKSDQPPSKVVEQMSLNKIRVCLLRISISNNLFFFLFFFTNT